jgi:predicted ATPase
MSMRGCVVIAIEGTHACGKTTLVHALTAHYRAQGINVACTGEPARTSPFCEEVVIYGRGEFDLELEVDLFGAQLSTQLRAARHHQLLICDKTVMNVAAYAGLVLHTEPDTQQAIVLEAMRSFCAAWAPVYDAVFFCPDTYTQPNDPFRAKVLELQDATATAVHDACTQAGANLHDLPRGLSLDQRVDWITARVDPLLAAAGG